MKSYIFERIIRPLTLTSFCVPLAILTIRRVSHFAHSCRALYLINNCYFTYSCRSCAIHEKIYFNFFAVGADNGSWGVYFGSTREVDKALSFGIVDGDAEGTQQQPKDEDAVIYVHLDQDGHQWC